MKNIGLFNSLANFFQKDKLTAAKLINLLNQGYSILQVNRQLYDIPEVRTAINFVAEKIASVPFYHIRGDTEGNMTMVNDSFQYVLNVRTNKYQCPQVFWTQMITIYLVANNAFAMPEWNDNGTLAAMYVLPFTQFEFTQDENGKLIIVFNGNLNYSFYYDDIIHLQRFPTFKGGAPKQATGNYTKIVGTMQNQAVGDSETSGRISALLQVKSQLKSSDMEKKLKEFKDTFLTAENTTGMGMIGAEYELLPYNFKNSPLNTELLTEVIKQLYNYFGPSYEIINGTAGELEYEQFIDNKAKPIIYQIEEELTYKLFSSNEIYFNNKIQAETVDLEISTLAAKTAFYKEMVYGTIMNRNEIRRRLGMPRGPAELDKFLGNKNFETLEPGIYEVGGTLDNPDDGK
ncbi:MULTISPECIES: phage portal protein [unclassified Clostridium]|uniref:phage portal protein n=1 Tax=unclassified Clostridium TaxID=2614128 RepID=UPI00029732DE|nr:MULTISPECIES: phage portal protein [unclassified Clostridium]EKQ50273.1 MAG: phage-related protein [Clostridium sp. Maddingley MBC34-26]